MKTNNLKIKILDRLINKNVDKQMGIVNYCDKNNIKLNNYMDEKVQLLKKLDDEVIELSERQDILIQKRIENTQKEYDKYLIDLKNEYQGFKYKVTNIKSGEAIYTNKIEEYLKDFNYAISCIIEGREYKKQGNKNYIEFGKKDTVYKIVREEIYSDDNKLVKLYLEKEKKSRVVYSKVSNNVVFKANGVNILMSNKSSFQIEQIQKAMDSFENDDEIKALFNEYNSYIYKKEKVVKETIEDRFKHMLNEYNEVIERHQDLKILCENREVLKGKYTGNEGVKRFYKEYKINNENWTNYLGNYNRFKFLSSIKIKEIEAISKSKGRFWRYPEKVWRWEDYKQIRRNGSY